MQSTDSLYLDKLKFDPKLKSGFMWTLIRKIRIVMLVILVLIAAGVSTFLSLPRELNPEVNIPIVSVITTLPGASPTDVEKLITKDIEQAISTISGIDTISSSSTNSVSAVTIQFNSNVNVDQALQDVKDEVDLVVSELPEDANDPTVSKLDFNEQPVVTVAITGDVNAISLTETAKELETILESESSINRVVLSGAETEEIVIQIDPETITTYGVSANTIVQAIQSNNLTLPAGTITIGNTEYSLSVNNEFTSIENVRNKVVSLGNQYVTLGEIADVYYRSSPTDSKAYARLSQDQRYPAIQLSVFKSDAATISDAAQIAIDTIDASISDNDSIQYLTVLNVATEVDKSFNDLVGNFQSTILLVFFILFVFLGLRQATIASISIPLTFLSAFIIMGIMGITVNFLSLFSLLLALGLVVDDAIVIVQAANNYGKKFKPDEAALLVYRDFVVPIWTTTLTTVWAFLPLILATGIIGAFIRSIPIVVSATLISSTTIAVLLNIPLTVIFANLKDTPKRVKIFFSLLGILLMAILVLNIAQGSPLAPLALIAFMALAVMSWYARTQLLQSFSSLNKNVIKKNNSLSKVQRWIAQRDLIGNGLINFQPVEKRYRDFLNNTVENKARRKLVYFATTAFVVASILFLATGLLKNEFFPSADNENFYINVEGPNGWQVEETEQVLKKVEAIVVEYPEVVSLISQTASTFDATGGGNGNLGSSNSNTGYVAVTLSDEDSRDRSSLDIAAEIREQVEKIPEAEVTVAEVSGGPPAGAAFQVNIKGEDLSVLEQISNDFMGIVDEIEGTINVDTTLKQTSGEVRLSLDDRALAERGLSAGQIGGFVRTALSGSDAGSISIGDDDTDITVTLNDKDTPLSQLQSLVLETQTGSYSLSEVANFTLETSPQSIVREDEQRVVRVLAGTEEGYAAPEILEEFEQRLEDYDLPAGYTWDVGGANEENQRSVNSILQAMGLSVVLILVTMVLQLESFRKSALVLVVIPLAVAGVFFNFTIFRIPLSFPALIGVLALFGIVVNNSIMLVEKINQNLSFGFKLKEAISDACASRLEPILLTSLTTSAGLLPITISDPFWRGLGGAIIAGLSVSGILILVVLPTLYYEVYKSEAKKTQ